MTTPARVDWLRPTTALVVTFGGILSALVMWAMHDALVDDAYMTLSYARDLAFHGQWGMIPGLPSNTATSPLDVMLLSALAFLVRSPMVAWGQQLEAHWNVWSTTRGPGHFQILPGPNPRDTRRGLAG